MPHQPDNVVTFRRSGASEPLQKPLKILKLRRCALLVAKALAQFLENFAGALRLDLIGYLCQQTRIRAIDGTFIRRAAEGIKPARITVRALRPLTLLLAPLHLACHLAGHALGALA